MDNQLHQIATAAREEMENFAREIDSCNADDLSCWCGISSYFLVMVGRKFGYHLSLVEGIAFNGGWDPDQPNHCWVEYQGKIIDITATQFADVNKIHIVEKDDQNYDCVRRNNAARKSLKCWLPEQSPYTHAHIKELRKRANSIVAVMA